MARIYQNEKVLMKEVGLIADFRIVIKSEIIVDFEGTFKEADELGDKLIEEPNVVSVDLYKHK